MHHTFDGRRSQLRHAIKQVLRSEAQTAVSCRRQHALHAADERRPAKNTLRIANNQAMRSQRATRASYVEAQHDVAQK
jgi:hypothetical protein